MKIRPLDPQAIASAFLRIADRIQTRTGCDRIAALQKAADGYPEAYRRYCAAMTEARDVAHYQDAKGSL